VANVIVIGASAGGIEALRAISRGLPGSLPAALFVVVHVSPGSPSMLPELLNSAGSLEALFAEDEDVIEPSRIYVAPPDHHLLIENGRMRVLRGPRENRHRPAIDPLFRTAARVYGSRVAGVILSGMLDDGTAGLQVVKTCRGIAIVQDPRDAMFSSMPENALKAVQADYVLPLAEIPGVLIDLVREPWSPVSPSPVEITEKVFR
jgi:two-component system chemotaxis response regulator CheB